jgi:hypothetical protein
MATIGEPTEFSGGVELHGDADSMRRLSEAMERRDWQAVARAVVDLGGPEAASALFDRPGVRRMLPSNGAARTPGRFWPLSIGEHHAGAM